MFLSWLDPSTWRFKSCFCVADHVRLFKADSSLPFKETQGRDSAYVLKWWQGVHQERFERISQRMEIMEKTYPLFVTLEFKQWWPGHMEMRSGTWRQKGEMANSQVIKQNSEWIKKKEIFSSHCLKWIKNPTSSHRYKYITITDLFTEILCL